MVINIEVKNKIARLIDTKAFIVCGNKDYKIKFSFDNEWAGQTVKTARFSYGGQYEDIVFEGDTCPVPVLKDTLGVAVGVYAGDLQTTTPAYINAKKSILCGGGLPAAPADNVYAQIIELLNKGGGAGGTKITPYKLTTELVLDGLAEYLNEEDSNFFEEVVSTSDYSKALLVAKDGGMCVLSSFAYMDSPIFAYTLNMGHAELKIYVVRTNESQWAVVTTSSETILSFEEAIKGIRETLENHSTQISEVETQISEVETQIGEVKTQIREVQNQIQQVDGCMWYTGAGAPSSDLGEDGDFYIDTVYKLIYRKRDGKWGNDKGGSEPLVDLNFGDYLTETEIDNKITETVGDINSILDFINGEVV